MPNKSSNTILNNSKTSKSGKYVTRLLLFSLCYFCTHAWVRGHRLFEYAAVIIIVCCHWLFAICFCCLLVLVCKRQDSFKKTPELITPRGLMWFVYVGDQPLCIPDPIKETQKTHLYIYKQCKHCINQSQWFVNFMCLTLYSATFCLRGTHTHIYMKIARTWIYKYFTGFCLKNVLNFNSSYIL